VQGAHFLSDVVFSGISVFAVVWLLALWFRLDADPRAVTGE
jgi:membrane-associated phospholipid phosphatase